MPEPPPREVALIHGVVADIETTTALRAEGRVVAAPHGWRAELWIDGEQVGWTSSLVDLPVLAQSTLIERLGRAWPVCPEHGRHPLRYVVHGERDGEAFRFERAAWVCPQLPMIGAEVGSLPRSTVHDDEDLPNGTVRWWNTEGGYGVIAGTGGDLWFHFSSVEGRVGFAELEEGERVVYEVEPEARQRVFRRARRVRRQG